MATVRKSQTRKKTAKNKSANRRIIGYFVSLIFIFFAATRLGIFGVTVYNLLRLLVGSTAYLALLLIVVALFLPLWKKDIFKTNRRLIPGVLLVYLGLLLIIQATFVAKFGNATTLWFVLDDLGHFTVQHWVGAGFIGWIFYLPFQMLFSQIGVTIVGIILMIVGVFVAVRGLISRMREQFSKLMADSQEKRAARQLEKEKQQATQKAQQELARQAALETSREKKSQMALEDPVEPQDLEALNFDNYEHKVVQTNPLGLMTDPGADWNDLVQEEKHLQMDKKPVDKQDIGVFHDPSLSADERVKKPLSADKDETNSHYQLPTSGLLTPIAPQDQSKQMALVKKNAQVLEAALASFNISAQVVSSTVGPSVTKYELKIATGTRVNRILNLADDLALALAARDVRIEAPIPGKSLVGVEIPNLQVATVGFRDVWDHAKTNPDNLLEVPLGKALDGSIRNVNLAKMPHLLIAGSTGSGKSVAVNGIIAGILMKAYPSEVKFLMVDPKMVELSVYNAIPHLLIPVVTNPRKAARALQKVVDEMEIRYEAFARMGVRNLEGYNMKLAAENATDPDGIVTPPMPLIVVIVDELSDLMMVASKEVEDAIIRLGQKARAAGIHMILATQRPSVDVISGLIKANVPSRVAFAVSSGTDSRTILDTNGAEKLLGRGDMLFKPIDENHPVRLQGAFLSDADVASVVNFIKSQALADYDESFDPGEAEGDDNRSGYAGVAVGESGDPLFEQAKAQVIMTQKASTAALQRSLKVGFNRATDLMNELEAAGVVGPAKGTTPRKVLMNLSGDLSEDED